jgi:hypothetical protein
VAPSETHDSAKHCAEIQHLACRGPEISAFSSSKKTTVYRFRFSEDFCVGVRNGYSPGQQPNVS